MKCIILEFKISYLNRSQGDSIMNKYICKTPSDTHIHKLLQKILYNVKPIIFVLLLPPKLLLYLKKLEPNLNKLN